jgi:dTDP-4-dehydrorhamnose reductase
MSRNFEMSNNLKNRMKRLLIVGGSGFVGGNLLSMLTGSDYEIHSTFHTNQSLQQNNSVKWHTLDLNNLIEIENLLSELSPEVIINISCLPVSKCDEQPEVAQRVQVTATEIFAKYCGVKKRLIHLSTDMIFSGSKGSAYTLSDVPNPISEYGLTKLMGEQLVLKNASNAVVIRSALVLGHGVCKPGGFTDWMISKIHNGEPLTLYKDQWRTPVIVEALCDLIKTLIGSDFRGLLHAGGGFRMSRVDMGCALLKGMGLEFDLIKQIEMPSMMGKTAMQRDLSMENSDFRKTLENKWGNPVDYLEKIGKEIRST